MNRTLFVTGDDFGLAVPVNRAIEQAHREGVLGAASLLIGAAAAQDAIARARANPQLRVGLHFALCGSRALSPAPALGLLANARGELRHPLVAFALLFLPHLRGAIEAELRAQFRAFEATGLPLDHVDGHNNLQLHPAVLPILLRVVREYGSPPIRLPYEPLLPSLRAAGLRGAWRRLAWFAMYPWTAYVKRRFARAGVRCNDYVFGIYDCGQLHLPLMLGIVRHLPPGTSELHCHVASERCPEIDRTMPHYAHCAELSALIDPRLMDAIERERIRLRSGMREC